MAEVEIFKLYALVLVRFSGLMISAPVLGSGNFPTTAKVGLTALAALIITPAVGVLETPLPEGPLAFGLMALGEVLIGLMIGFVMSIVFSSIQVAGQIMDMQSGFGMMNVFNPAMETQFPIFGFFLFILGVLYFLVMGFHHAAIRALAHTFEVIPPGGFAMNPGLLYEVSRWGRDMFIDGLIISAPIAASMLLAYITMGLLGRVVPQIHLFVVGFPITIATGLFVTAFIIGIYLRVLDGMLHRMMGNVDVLIRGMG